MKIAMLQTSDSYNYKKMLDMTAKVNILYCRKNNISYESYVGVKIGAAPWMATYNRIFMVLELLERGYDGWVIFADADAFVNNMNFDIRSYLKENDRFCLIGATGGSDAPWNINAGILFINLGDEQGREYVADWHFRFTRDVTASYLLNPESKWDDEPNDQELMYECIKGNPRLMAKTKREEAAIFNYKNGAFMRQAIRAGYPSFESRMNWIKQETDSILGNAALNVPYVDLTGLANHWGSDKGDKVGNKHGYTSFYQFLFEEFRLAEFEFLEIGLLRGGPEVGAPASTPGSDVPSVRMWLDYFPRAICHGIDISDFSNIKLERFQFHQGDMGVPADFARIKQSLPKLKFVLDDASHASFHQQMAFAAFFQLVEPGGYYIIEDMDWQPEAYEPNLPKCRLTRDVFAAFAESRQLDISFLGEAEKRNLASQIGSMQLLRSRGNGVTKMVAIQKR